MLSLPWQLEPAVLWPMVLICQIISRLLSQLLLWLFLDVLVAVMVGVASFAVVFTENMEPASGPGLMFIALPVALAHLPMGDWVLPFFFVLLVFATWTSSVNLGEPLVVFASRKLGSRAKGALAAGGVIWLIGLVPALSLNVLGQLEPLPGKTLFDVYTAFPTQVLLPITGVLTLIFAGSIVEKKLLVCQLGLTGYQLKLWIWLIKICQSDTGYWRVSSGLMAVKKAVYH